MPSQLTLSNLCGFQLRQVLRNARRFNIVSVFKIRERPMTIDQLNMLLENLASITIIATLIFVGFQVRQNTSALRLNATTAALESWVGLASSVASDPELAEATERNSGQIDADKSIWTDAEQSQLYYFDLANLKTMEVAFINWRNGLLDDRLWEGYRHGIANNFSSDRIRNSWDVDLRHFHSKDFQAYVDDVIAQSNGATSASAP
jgi:hypothetical protein